jgi:hypothetical protein
MALTGFAIQINAILVNSSFYTSVLQGLVAQFPDSIFWNFPLSPMFNQWQALYLDYPADNFLLRLIQSENSVFGFLILILGVLCLMITTFIWSQHKGSTLFSSKTSLVLLPVPAIMLLFAFLLVLRLDPFYYGLTAPVEEACKKIDASASFDDLIVVRPYPSQLWYAFLNQDCTRYNWYSLPYGHNLAEEQTAQNLILGLLNKLPSSASQIWLIQPSAPPDSDSDINLVAELNKSAQFENEFSVGKGTLSISVYISKNH